MSEETSHLQRTEKFSPLLSVPSPPIRIIGVIFILCAVVQFAVPEWIQGPSTVESVEEQIDLRLRYAAPLLGFGFFLFFGFGVRHASAPVKGWALLLAMALGFIVTRFFGLLEHGFDSGSQLGWLFIEATLAVALWGPLNLHRKRLQDEPS